MEGDLMSPQVIAFVDDSQAATPVVAMAGALGEVLSATVEAVHVGKETGPTAQAVARAAGIPIRLVSGDPAEAIVAQMAPTDVAAGVLGARRHPLGLRPAGHIALEVITRVDKLVAVVPPDAEVPLPGSLDRILIPLDGTAASAKAVERLCEVFARSGIEILVLHVFDKETTPRFWDQPYYAAEAYASEFLARFVKERDAKMTLRSGTPQHDVLTTAAQEGVDLISLGWSQSLSPGRAEVVRRVLSEAPVPVLLVPST
jgi:nucleotide-binding universal stress UspA family protein